MLISTLMELYLSANLVNEMSVADRLPGISEYGSVDPVPLCDGNDLNQFKTILLMRISKCLNR